MPWSIFINRQLTDLCNPHQICQLVAYFLNPRSVVQHKVWYSNGLEIPCRKSLNKYLDYNCMLLLNWLTIYLLFLTTDLHESICTILKESVYPILTFAFTIVFFKVIFKTVLHNSFGFGSLRSGILISAVWRSPTSIVKTTADLAPSIILLRNPKNCQQNIRSCKQLLVAGCWMNPIAAKEMSFLEKPRFFRQ